MAANTVATTACSADLEHLVTDVKRDFPHLARVGSWQASCHYGFYANGIPRIAFGSMGMGKVIYHPWDDLYYMCTDKLGEVVRFTIDLITRLSKETPTGARAFSLVEARRDWAINHTGPKGGRE